MWTVSCHTRSETQCLTRSLNCTINKDYPNSALLRIFGITREVHVLIRLLESDTLINEKLNTTPRKVSGITLSPIALFCIVKVAHISHRMSVTNENKVPYFNYLANRHSKELHWRYLSHYSALCKHFLRADVICHLINPVRSKTDSRRNWNQFIHPMTIFIGVRRPQLGVPGKIDYSREKYSEATKLVR